MTTRGERCELATVIAHVSDLLRGVFLSVVEGWIQVKLGAGRLALGALAASPVGDFALRVAHKYIEISQGFSYDIFINGETDLIWNLNKVRPLGVVFDVGANKGTYSTEVLRVATSAQIHMFEPDAGLSTLLEDRFAGEPRVKIVNAGLGREVGVLPMKKYPSAQHINTLVLTPTPHDESARFVVEEASIVSGDAYCGDEGIDRITLLKIDVEGFEYEVLNGFSGMLEQRRIDLIQFEYGYISGLAGRLLHDFSNFLVAHGFIMSPLRRRGLDFHDWTYADNDFHSGPNWIATNPSLAAELAENWEPMPRRSFRLPT